MRTQFLISALLLGVAAAGCSSNSGGFAANVAPATQSTANVRTLGPNDAFPGAHSGAMSRSVNWSEFGFIPSGGRFNPKERMLSLRTAHRLHKLWSFFTGCSGSFCGGSSPTLANGVIYVGSYDDNVYALNATTGAKVWSYTTGNLVLSSPALANHVVYVGSEDGNVYALNAATRAKLWSYTTGNQVFSSPAVANGAVGNLYAFGR